MATIPTTLGANPVPDMTQGVHSVSVNPYDAALQTARGIGTAGRSLLQAGETADKELIAANELAVEDAINQAKQKSLDLAYDPDKGYLNIKGGNAIHRPNNQPLHKEVGDAFNDELNRIATNLTPRQRELFKVKAEDLGKTLQEDVRRHYLNEFKNYNDSVQDGKIKVAEQSIQSFYNDPLKINQSVLDIERATYIKGKTAGLAPDEIAATQMAARSGAYASALNLMAANNNATMANDMFKVWKSKMLPSDMVKVKSTINDITAKNLSFEVTQKTNEHFNNRINPQPIDRLYNVVGKPDMELLNIAVAEVESGNRNYEAEGNLIVSPKGAMGKMQVMPATAKNAGYGIAPAKDNSPEELERVGKEYLQAMIKEFDGDLSMALAAYNAGPYKVKGAIASSLESVATGDPKSWDYFLPDETKKYVSKVMQKYDAGEGTKSIPTESEYVREAITRLPSDADISVRNEVIKSARSEYNTFKQDLKTREDNLLAEGQRMLISSNGDLNRMPEDFKKRVQTESPSVWKSLTSFSKEQSENKPFDPILYNELLANGDTMSDSEFFSKVIKMRKAQQVDLIKARQTKEIKTTVFNNAFASAMFASGINANQTSDMDERQRTERLKAAVFNIIVESGQPLNNENAYSIVSNILNKQTVTDEGWLWDTKKKMAELSYDDIPDDFKEEAVKLFEARGMAVNEEAVLKAYILKNKGA